MIADEVMAGFGRCGEWFAVDHWDVTPDLICFAKGVNSGYVPLGGVDHQPAHRRHVRRPRRTPAGSPTPATRWPAPRPSPASTSSRRRASSSTPATSATDVIGPALADMADAPPVDRRGARPRRVLGHRAGPDRETREPLVPYNAAGADGGADGRAGRGLQAARPVAVHPLQPHARRAAAHDHRRRGARGPGRSSTRPSPSPTPTPPPDAIRVSTGPTGVSHERREIRPPHSDALDTRLTRRVRRLFHRDQPGPARRLAGRSSPPARRSGGLLDDDERTRLGELADDAAAHQALGGRPRLRAHRRGAHAGRRPRRAARARPRRVAPYDGVGTIVVRGRAMTPHGADGRAGQGRADGRARRRRRRGPPRRRPDHARVVVGPARGGQPAAGAATSCCTSSATSSTCSTARSTARRRSTTTTLRTRLGRGAARAEYQARARPAPTAGCASYAGTNPGEFFAVATEAFFTLPVALQQDKPALYDVLAGYYRQDPAARVRAVLLRQHEDQPQTSG